MKQPVDSKCRMCLLAEHVGSTILAPSEYANQCNKVAGRILWMICKHMGLHVTGKY